jgi:hypothetical protein
VLRHFAKAGGGLILQHTLVCDTAGPGKEHKEHPLPIQNRHGYFHQASMAAMNSALVIVKGLGPELIHLETIARLQPLLHSYFLASRMTVSKESQGKFIPQVISQVVNDHIERGERLKAPNGFSDSVHLICIAVSSIKSTVDSLAKVSFSDILHVPKYSHVS